MIALFITALGLGAIFNISPGAVFTETLRVGSIGGYRPALNVQLGSLVGDATWAILGLAGAGFLFQISLVRVPLSIAGCLYLLYLGISSLLERPRLSDSYEGEKFKCNEKNTFYTGASISLTNPQNIFFWGALGSVLGGVGVSDPQIEHYAVFFMGFMVSSILWCFLCAALIRLIYRSISIKYILVINILCGLTLIFLSFASAFDLYKDI